ncbi:MAG: hypothetical protein V3T84_14890 [Phycisphaerales bacterium]
MLKCAMMADFSINMPDEPGELSRLTAMLREAGINLVALWGYGPGTGEARFYCVPEQAEQFRSFVNTAGFQVQEGKTLYLSGADEGGALVETLQKIAAAGINLQAIEAVAIRGEFGCFLWADEQNWDALANLLT